MRFLFFLFFFLLVLRLRFILHCEPEGGARRRYWSGTGTVSGTWCTYRFGELVQRGIYAIRIARRRLWWLRCGHRGSGSEAVDLHTSSPCTHNHTLLYCARLTGILYILYTQQQLDTTSTHTLAHTHTSTATIGGMRSPL